jgi:hypothetical protein
MATITAPPGLSIVLRVRTTMAPKHLLEETLQMEVEPSSGEIMFWTFISRTYHPCRRLRDVRANLVRQEVRDV